MHDDLAEFIDMLCTYGPELLNKSFVTGQVCYQLLRSTYFFDRSQLSEGLFRHVGQYKGSHPVH